jgi:hypothetical protein
MKQLKRLLEKGKWEPGQVIFWVQEVVDDARTAERERIVGEIEKLRRLNLPNDDVWNSWENGYHCALQDITNLIKSNKSNKSMFHFNCQKCNTEISTLNDFGGGFSWSLLKCGSCKQFYAKKDGPNGFFPKEVIEDVDIIKLD